VRKTSGGLLRCPQATSRAGAPQKEARLPLGARPKSLCSEDNEALASTGNETQGDFVAWPSVADG